MPLVSVIIPAYNLEEYIEEAVRSVLGQTFTDIEVIIVDDGSVDSTPQVIAKLASLDSRIKLVHQANGGVAKARNEGLKEAQGEFITFLDGDDLWYKEFLGKAVKTMLENTEINAVYGGYDRLFNKYKAKYRYGYPEGDLLVPKEPVRIFVGCMLIRRDLLSTYKIMFTEGCVIGEDWEFVMKILSFAKVKALRESVMLYRQRAGSAIHSKWDWQKHVQGMDAVQRIIDFIASELPVGKRKELALRCYKHELGMKTLKCFWRMYTKGYRKEMKELLRLPKYQEYLKHIDQNKLSFINKLKYKFLMW